MFSNKPDLCLDPALIFQARGLLCLGVFRHPSDVPQVRGLTPLSKIFGGSATWHPE